MTRRQLSLLLLAVTVSAATYAGYRAQARRAAVLARITALDACLAACNGQRAWAADNILTYLHRAVRHNYNQPASVAVQQEAEQLAARTEQLADTLHLLRQRWQATGRVNLGRLPEQLARYRTFMQTYSPAAVSLTFQPTALPAQPLAATLAALTGLETQARHYEVAALRSEANKVIDEAIYDKQAVMVIPESRTVAPGAPYQARLLLVAAEATGRQRFSADGRALPIDPLTNHGLVRFTVPPARPGQPDTVRAQWLGRVQLNQNGSDTTLQVTVPYLIAKRPTL